MKVFFSRTHCSRSPSTIGDRKAIDDGILAYAVQWDKFWPRRRPRVRSDKSRTGWEDQGRLRVMWSLVYKVFVWYSLKYASRNSDQNTAYEKKINRKWVKLRKPTFIQKNIICQLIRVIIGSKRVVWNTRYRLTKRTSVHTMGFNKM